MRKRRGDAEAAAVGRTREVRRGEQLGPTIGEQITDRKERAMHLMRLSAAMQSEAMELFAEIAVLQQYRNFAWKDVLKEVASA